MRTFLNPAAQWMSLIAATCLTATSPALAQVDFANAPQNPIQRIGSAAFSHPGTIWGVRWSDNGKFIATLPNGSVVRLYDAVTGDVLRELDHGDVKVTSLTIASGSRTILTGGSDGTVRIWEAETGKVLTQFRDHKRAARQLTAVSYSPRQHAVAAASTDGYVRIWNSKDEKILARLGGFRHRRLIPVVDTEYSPDGQQIAIAERNGVFVVSLGNNKPTRLDKPLSRVRDLAVSPDGQTLAVASLSGTSLYELTSLKLIADLDKNKQSRGSRPGVNTQALAVAFSPDGKTLASLKRGQLTLWDVATHAIKSTISKQMTSVAFSPDSRRVAVGLLTGKVGLFDVESGKRLSTEPHDGGVQALFSRDEKQIITSSVDGTVRIWDRSTGKSIKTFDAPSAVIMRTSKSHRGDLFATSDRSGKLYIWESTTEKVHPAVYVPGEIITTSAFSPDDSDLAYLMTDGDKKASILVVTEVDTPEELFQLNDLPYPSYALAYSPDGKVITVQTARDKLALLNAKTGNPIREPLPVDSPVTHITFSADGAKVALSNYRQPTRVVDVKTGETVTQLEKGRFAAAFSPDGQYVAVGSADNFVRVYHAVTGKLLLERNAHQHWITSVQFSADGRSLLVGSADATATVWSLTKTLN